MRTGVKQVMKTRSKVWQHQRARGHLSRYPGRRSPQLFNVSRLNCPPGQVPSLILLSASHTAQDRQRDWRGRGRYLGVDERDADPVIVKQHAALGSVLVQLLVEQQEEEVSDDQE